MNSKYRGQPFIIGKEPLIKREKQVERSHRTDQEEFYQLLTYTDDVDLNKKLAEWERFYYLDRPHGAFKGKTPYEALRCMLE